MRVFVRLFAVALLGVTAFGGMVNAAKAPDLTLGTVASPLREAYRASERTVETPIVFRHGDISWLPDLAKKAGWPDNTIGRLGRIILRESGGCPNRRGGDVVDKNCNITGVSEWNHRSDTGLLQLNGTHWKPDHAQYSGTICRRMGICTQEPLLDAYTNLVAGKLLYDAVGFTPWNIPTK